MKLSDRENELFSYNFLKIIPGLTEKDLTSLLSEYKLPSLIVENLKDILVLLSNKSGANNSDIPVTAADLDELKKRTEKILNRVDSKYSFIFKEEGGYPDILFSSSDAPYILYYRGNIHLLDENMIRIGFTGSRNASSRILSASKQLALEILNCGAAAVTGLARGVDTAVSAAAAEIENGIIAVIGTPLNIFYPPENRFIQTKISERGLLLSGFSFTEKVMPYFFNKRNKIIAAISTGLVVMECSDDSGTFGTAEYSANIGKQLFIYPQDKDISDERWYSQLRKKGALDFKSVDDLLENIKEKQGKLF